MEDKVLYHQIAETIRRDILERRIEPGSRLPTVRAMTVQWNCTAGTIQRAYQELAGQGLITSRPGKGTRVSAAQDEQLSDTSVRSLRSLRSLRKAALVNQAEGVLLGLIMAGNKLDEIERAFDLAADRWRSMEAIAEPQRADVLRIGGSHDPLLTAVVARMAEGNENFAFEIRFNGSLGGLMALAEGKVDLAGCHLWDQQTGVYNVPFVQRLLPGRHVAVIHMARRRIGLMVAPGNPRNIVMLEDLPRPGVRFINRQAGSGTRVWLEAQLSARSIESCSIDGYANECVTHSEVARMVAEGKADVGLGLEASAVELGLDFTFLTEERYDLVCLEAGMRRPEISWLVNWLNSPAAALIGHYPGYDGHECGQVAWL